MQSLSPSTAAAALNKVVERQKTALPFIDDGDESQRDTNAQGKGEGGGGGGI
jgi:hypothetical protein